MHNHCFCPFCESHDLELVTNSLRLNRKADVYKCRNCTLIFLDQSSFRFSKDFYKKEYHQTYLTHVEPDALDPQKYFEKMKKTTLPWAELFREMLTGKEVVLDFGCSTGHFMELVKDKTKEIYGIDLNKKEVDFCRSALKLNVSDEPLEERFKPNTFDYITMIFVLEHIGDPVAFLNSLKKFLKPEGKIVILVPNIRDPLINFYHIPEFHNFYYCIEHLYYYNPSTIKNLFDKVGLAGTIEVVQEYPITNHLNWVYSRAPSDVLASRRGIPTVSLVNENELDEWTDLWRRFNEDYREFMVKKGFADRIWCVVGR